MPIREPVFKSSLLPEITSFIDEKRQLKKGARDGDTDFLDIMEFIEKFNLLPEGLYPVQRFIVKLYYNIPLNSVDKTIKITDRFGGEVLHWFTETEYLRYLYDSGRCNIKEEDGRPRRELILVLGRRSGKSALSAIFAAYELYKLLKRGVPQSFYGLMPGSEIRILCIANDKEQASIVFTDVQSHVESVDYFKNSKSSMTQTLARFRTEGDRKRNGDLAKGSITATFKSSIAKGLRGRGIICAILDEIAFFVDDGKSSAERVYKAIFPSLAQFSPKDPKNKHVPIGPSEGRMVLISSPDAKEGFFYRMYETAKAGGKASKNMLVIQAPTWEVNPTLSKDYYEGEFAKDPKSFMTEHGAEFSDRVRGWIEDWKDLTDCIVPDLRPSSRGLPREPHWAGVDFGLSNDGTAIALTTLTDGKIRLAYHEIWYPKKKWKESNPHLEAPLVPYANGLEGVMRLDLDEISSWFLALSKLFYIQGGVFDQWAGPVFEQVLHKKGLRQFEMKNFFATDSSQMWQTFRMALLNRQVSLYDWPRPEASGELVSLRHSPLITELLELQATSGGKNIITVEAPDIVGKHDDQSDALARSVMLAMDYVRSNPGILEATAKRFASQVSTSSYDGGYAQYHRLRNKVHSGGGSSRRSAPRSLPRVRSR
ncbi:MAG: hypothetical protein BWY99_01870 [Synergistetes bacterium ADurb.BinA166]|nr:MAG: hypothetical protein BWY99_01870 [Synergistetes bacterium ADurb.BinA166]